MSSALNESSAIRRFEGTDTIEICDGITFNFYTGLPHITVIRLWYTLRCTVQDVVADGAFDPPTHCVTEIHPLIGDPNFDILRPFDHLSTKDQNNRLDKCWSNRKHVTMVITQ